MKIQPNTRDKVYHLKIHMKEKTKNLFLRTYSIQQKKQFDIFTKK